MFIRSERLFLRPAWPEDAQDLHAAIADERVVRNLVRAPWPYDLEDARAFAERPQDRCHPSLLITLPTAGGSRVIGGIGLNQEAGGSELGYWITPAAWGRGFATEAASAVLRLSRTLGHRRIGARHFLDNPASGRVLEKVGFKPTDIVTQRLSLGRGSPAPSREYRLQFTSAGDCGLETPADPVPDEGMRAA